MLGVYSLMHIA